MPCYLNCFGGPSTQEDGESIAGEQGLTNHAPQIRASSIVHNTPSDGTTFSRSNVGDSASDTDQNYRPPVDWVIGLDFGTTYSGFAYARVRDDPEISVFYDWPRKQSEKTYSKTLTALHYRLDEEGSTKPECSTWGYIARSDYIDSRRQNTDVSHGIYLTSFKLMLMRGLDDLELAACVPAPLTVMSIITDYLRFIGEYALTVVRNHHMRDDMEFGKDLVQWVVTVPSIWEENAKQQMKTCMVNAGLVGVGGIDSVQVVLEPEAASFHCHEILRQQMKKFSLKRADRILVVDAGGGTVDIVVQEMIGNSQAYQVQELTESSGGLCGGTFVDESFMRFMSQKIPCLQDFFKDYPSYKARLLKDWEEIKCSFGHDVMSVTDTKDINLHHKLAERWETYQTNHNNNNNNNNLSDTAMVELTQQDLNKIFDPAVDDILQLIAAQLAQVTDIKVMFVVGGFASSPYLMQRIRTRFSDAVNHIVSPPAPGSAIVQGAVSLALHPEAIVSRIAKKTYGTSVILPFDNSIDPVELLRMTDGVEYCRNRFDVFVRKGERVEVDKCVTKNYVPHGDDQRLMVFDLWSSTDKDPRYVDQEGTMKEGDFAVSLPVYNGASGKLVPRFDLSMYFGRSHIEMRAVGSSGGFKSHSLVLPVKFCS